MGDLLDAQLTTGLEELMISVLHTNVTGGQSWSRQVTTPVTNTTRTRTTQTRRHNHKGKDVENQVLNSKYTK